MNTVIGIDIGTSGLKTTDETGNHYLPAQIGEVTRDLVNMAALEDGATRPGKLRRSTTPSPTRIGFDSHTFLVGENAHAAANPVTLTLSTERMNDTPYARALYYAALTPMAAEYAQVDVAVGLPLSVLTGPDAVENKEAVRAWMRGKHIWRADGVACSIEVVNVWLPTQASAALAHHLKACNIRAFEGQEFAAISIGAGTFEVEVRKFSRGRMELQSALSGSFEQGARVLLNRLPNADAYTFSELDALLRADPGLADKYLAGWWSDLAQSLARIWGPKLHTRMQFVLAMGGGALLLQDKLKSRFNGKLRMPDDPIHAVSQGLYTYAVQQAQQA